MNSKTTAIVAYITLIGFIIAYITGDRESEFAKFHLNQALVLFLCNIVLNVLSFIPIVQYVAALAAIVVFVLWILGLVGAVKGSTKPLPLIGGISVLK